MKYFAFILIAFTFSSFQTDAPVGLTLGNTAPEIELKNPEGEIVKLSSLRGKMVLIDFWASWCGPCRRENAELIKAYKLFKDKKFKSGNSFTVYSVSLDVKPEAWKSAIAYDSLVWASHVSDLAGWNSSATTQYQVSNIPSNFLINDKGIIINKNLHGEDLINALHKLVVE